MKGRATLIASVTASLVVVAPAGARTYLDSGGAGARTHLDSGGAGGRTHLDSGGAGGRTHLDSDGVGATKIGVQRSDSGFQWSDAGIGAGITGGVILLLAGTSVLIRPYRRSLARL